VPNSVEEENELVIVWVPCTLPTDLQIDLFCYKFGVTPPPLTIVIYHETRLPTYTAANRAPGD
jgi:hypothetical protein